MNAFTIILLKDKPEEFKNTMMISTGNQLAAEHKIRDLIEAGMDRRDLLVVKGRAGMVQFDIEPVVPKHPWEVKIRVPD